MTKETLEATVIKDGFHTLDEVYRNVQRWLAGPGLAMER